MQSQALQNIFEETEPNTRYVEVIKKISQTKYQTIDVYGRKWMADSSTAYRVGSFVVIQFNRIVGYSQPFTDPINYEV